MKRTHLTLSGSMLILAVAAMPRLVHAYAFDDEMNRTSFDASANGWIVQSYAKGQGTFGLTPASVDSGTAFSYGVNVDGSGNVTETNTVTSQAFTIPTTPGQYVQFSANMDLSAAAASTPGLVFALSTYKSDSSGNEYGANIEFPTSQLSSGSNPNDDLMLSTYNDYSGDPSGEWSENVESDVDATSGFQIYSIRLFSNQVQFLVNNNVIATSTSDVPTGEPLYFELNAWAPTAASWPSAAATLPDNSYSEMDVDWARVSYDTTTANTVWQGDDTATPTALKDSANWTAGAPASGKQGLIDDSVSVPATLYFGDTSTSLGVSQTMGALLIDSSTLTAIDADASTPSSSTTYSIAFVGNTGNTVPLISLGENVSQAVSISDSTNAILNLQIGVAGAVLDVTNASASLTINSKLIDKSGITSAFTKTGAGTLVLTNTGDTYGGSGAAITISGGTLSVNANGELGNTANTITLDGGALEINPASALTLARSIFVDPNGGGINLPTESVTLSSPLTGSGTLTKTGTAELVLNNGAGAFDGTVDVNQGNFRLINPGSTAAGTTVALNGVNSTLNLRADGDATYNANVQLTANPGQIYVANQSAGITNNVLTVGNISLGATTLNIGGTSGYTAAAPSLTLTGNGTVSTNTTSLAVQSVSETGGSQSLTKQGVSAFTAGPLNISGNLDVAQGPMVLAHSSPASTSTIGSLSIASGATLDLTNNMLDVLNATDAGIAGLIQNGELIDSEQSLGMGIGYAPQDGGETVGLTWLGDLNMDGVINNLDFQAMQDGNGTSWSQGDLNGDGKIDQDDWSLFDLGAAMSNGRNISTVLPEPALGLLGLALPLVLRRRRELAACQC